MTENFLKLKNDMLWEDFVKKFPSLDRKRNHDDGMDLIDIDDVNECCLDKSIVKEKLKEFDGMYEALFEN